MFQFFDYITNVIGMLWDILVSTITEMFNFLVMIRNGVSFGMMTITMLPPFCKGAILTIISIAVVTFVLKMS